MNTKITAFMADESQAVGLDNFRIYLERLPDHLDNFLKNLGLPLLSSSTHPAMSPVAARAQRDIPLWPKMATELRQFHVDVTRLIDDAIALVTQLNLYEQSDDSHSALENLNTLRLHAAPFTINGKLGISPSSKTYEVTHTLSETLIAFENRLYIALQDMKLIQQSTVDIIPRVIDFMRVKIAEHEARHRRQDSTFTEPVRKQLEAAYASLQSSRAAYFAAVEAANRLHAYCTLQRDTLADSRRQLLRISEGSNVRIFVLQMNLMSIRLVEANRMIKRIRELL